MHSVHRFIGLASYFRRFIPSFASIAKPLYDLLKKDAIFKFGKVEVESFEALRAKLSESPFWLFILLIWIPSYIAMLPRKALEQSFFSVRRQVCYNPFCIIAVEQPKSSLDITVMC